MSLGYSGNLKVETEFTAEAGDLTSDQDYLFNANMVYTDTWDLLSPSAWSALKQDGTEGAHFHLRKEFSGVFVRDQWTDFVIHFANGYTKATGTIELWTRTGGVLTKRFDIPAFPTNTSTFPISFLKMGIYSGVQTSSETYTIHIDSWRAYDENGTFNAVDPAQDD